MLDTLLPKLLDLVVPMLEVAIVVLLGIGVSLLRKAPAVLRATLKEFKKQSTKTKTQLDDAIVAIAERAVDALEKGLEQELPEKKPKLKQPK
jgi:Sec-independent protein translocase protein TatA